jgi:4-amino-4-deoxy-L-arabinose transferase-like glycosyltransferase
VIAAGTPARAGGALAAMLIAAALLLLPSLGAYPLFDVDEGAFSEATREMLASGDWLSTTLNGLARYDKPILVYWLQAASVRAFGFDEFALRLPSALAGLAWVAMVARFAIPRLGLRAGLLAGWVAATSLGVMAMSRAATADALLNALLVATVLDLWRHLESGRRAPLLRAWLWAALGVLTKGPIALLIPAATALLFAATGRRWREVLRAGFDPAGWALMVAVALPWYAVQWHLHGREFIDGFFLRHNLERFGGPLEGHGGSIGYYVVVVPLLLLPWTALLWRVAREAPALWRDRSAPLPRFLLCWFGFVLVFFSLSGTKLPHYALYGVTPLFLLLGRAAAAATADDAAGEADGAGGRGSAGARLTIALAALLCLAFLAAPTLAQMWSQSASGAKTAFYAAQAARALALGEQSDFALIAGGCLAASILLAVPARRPGLVRLAAATGMAAFSFSYAFAPWAGALLNDPVRDAGALARRLGGSAVTWNITAPAFSVYREAVTPSRAPVPGELALTRIDRLDPAAPVDVLLREGGVALVRARSSQSAP